MLLKDITFLALATATFISAADGYWRMNCGVVQVGRIDPVVSPGAISSHTHKLVGASNIGFNSTYETMQEASCTSCEISKDKSGYWTPLLYYEHKDGTFEEVAAPGMTVYYLGRGDDAANIQPFPPGFRMLSGSAAARSYDNATLTATTGGRPVSDRVSFNCLDYNNPQPEQPWMWNTTCPDGLRAQIQFQSCWNGKDNYTSDNSHVAYMSQIDNGICPPGYPVQLVHLFYEVLYSMDSVTTDGGRFVFAQGDPTGYGFHGDFLNGWDMPTQEAALAQCANNAGSSGTISECAVLNAVDDVNYSSDCPTQPQLINEPTRGRIAKLPGCITVFPGPGAAPSSDTTCPVGTVPPTINASPTTSGADVTFIPTPGQTVDGTWEFVGCASDSGNTRALSGPALTNSTSMTTEMCMAYCTAQGYQLAGTEYASQCYCGSSLSSSSSLNQTGCNMVCKGNNTQWCGGPSLLSVYSSKVYTTPAAPVSVKSVGSYSFQGCYSDNGSSRALTGPTYTDTKNMTAASCINYCQSKGQNYAGMEYGQECYCGAEISSSGTLVTDQTQCSMSCSGNASEYCGAGDRLSVYESSINQGPSVVPSVGTYESLGCYTDNVSGRALTGSAYTNATAMTVASCVSFCQNVGSNFAGVEWSQECYCGNSIANGATLVADQTQCSMTCSGNSSEYCGAGNRLNIYNSTVNEAPAVVTSVGKYLSQGCYTEGIGGRALQAASYTNTTGMTVESCVAFCTSKGMPYAGVEYAQECYCDSAIRLEATTTSSGDCSMTCTGNGKEYCGAGNRLNVYLAPKSSKREVGQRHVRDFTTVEG
ncbi:MAG: hypothetical protein M1827_000486 [Pycnora praestabilis]|nr:MAG: hypothetical protein M1827_000486 [Pycnora praestabilis]